MLMFRKRLRARVVGLSLLFLMAVLRAPLVLAQPPAVENVDLARVVMVTVKDGRRKAFERAVVDSHRQSGWRYQWFSVISGPDTGSYIAYSGGHDWADFDNQSDGLVTQSGGLNQKVQPFVADNSVRIIKAAKEFRHWPESLEGYHYFAITEWHVGQGTQVPFYRGLSEIERILKAGGVSYFWSFHRVISGGSGKTLLLINPYKNFADMAPRQPGFGELMSAALSDKKGDGREALDDFIAKWKPTYRTGNNYLTVYRADLSGDNGLAAIVAGDGVAR